MRHEFIYNAQSADPEYAWVSRHTWQSWRERYKKNATRLDTLIAAIVEQKKPMQGEKGQYGYVRQAEEKPKRTRKKKSKNVEQPSKVADDAYTAIEGLAGHRPMSMGVLQGMVPINLQGPNFQVLTDLQNGTPVRPTPSSSPLDPPAVRKSPAEEEMDEERDEWAVRIGNSQPPAWGKRKPSDEGDGESARKRMRQG